MRTIAIIPARANSRRLIGKNYKLLGGVPLVVHSILYAKANADIIDAIYVSTNCVEVKRIALEHGVEVIDRPAALAGDTEPTVSALKHAAETISDVENFVLLQPTNPLRPVSLLKDAYRLWVESARDSLFTVTRNHHKLGKIIDNQFVPFNYSPGQRTQDLEPLFFENGLLYLSKFSLVLQDKIISETALPMVVDHPFADIDIDTQHDFDKAQMFLDNNLFHEL